MFICDLHIHSKYSRATSLDMDVEHLSQWAELKGIKLLGTGDFTHPEWLKELKDKLSYEGGGIYKHRNTYFLLTGEVCNIFLDIKSGRVKKIHHLILSPHLSEVERINEELKNYGNLSSDGRPILEIDSRTMLKKIKKVSSSSHIIPAHVWTPHFSLFGANSGFDRIEDCFGEETREIFALETGLSSDPLMNRRLSSLDRFNLISNSDAHSPAKIGREANCLDCPIDYEEIIKAFKTGEHFLYTVEFFPQEGKYHYDGHRNCGMRMAPEEAMRKKNLCPLCQRPVTIGVMHRVLELANREKEKILKGEFVGYKYLVPLEEIIADAIGVGVQSREVRNKYLNIVKKCGGELPLLLEAEDSEIKENISPDIALRILAVREGKVVIKEGYDGVYGEVKIKPEGKKEEQLTLF